MEKKRSTCRTREKRREIPRVAAAGGDALDVYTTGTTPLYCCHVEVDTRKKISRCECFFSLKKRVLKCQVFIRVYMYII